MKNIKPLLFLFLLLPLMGCEALEELIEEEFDLTISFTGDLEIVSESSVNEPTDPITVRTDMATYNIASDPDIADVIGNTDEITKIKIDRIRYLYKDFLGNEEAFVIEGGFSFVNQNMSVSTFQILDTNINVAEADSRNDTFVLEDDFSEVEEGFDPRSPSVLIGYFATLSHNPVDFKVGITVDVTVSIKPDIDNF